MKVDVLRTCRACLADAVPDGALGPFQTPNPVDGVCQPGRLVPRRATSCHATERPSTAAPHWPPPEVGPRALPSFKSGKLKHSSGAGR